MPPQTVRDVFVQTQEGHQSHGKLVKNLKVIYHEMEIDEFWPVFVEHLKYSMIVFKREVAVERTLEFVAKFATALASSSTEAKTEGKEGAEDVEEEDMPELLLKLMDFFLQHHNAGDRAVRFRCCQMVNKLLTNLGENALIDDDLYDRIYDCMLQRLRDKIPIVRVQAVLALARLQDPLDKDCPIINAYLFLLGCDTSTDVRRAVLTSVAVSTKTLPAILERTRDVIDAVRKLAYQIIAEKVHIRALTIAQRVQLLQQGLNDRIVNVKEACTSRLLQRWVQNCEGSIVKLLKSLDVENSTEVSMLAMKAIFGQMPLPEVIQNFDLLNEQLVMEVDKLTSEGVLYWRCLCEYIQSQDTDVEQYLDKVRPTGTVFAQYLQGYVETSPGLDDPELQLKHEFIQHQLLLLAATLDLTEEVGRKQVDKLLYDMLVSDSVSHQLVEPLLARYTDLHREPVARINSLVEVISDIRVPMNVKDTEVDLELKRQQDIKLAGVRVELNQLRDELEECVARQDFGRAAQVKERVQELEMKRNELMEDPLPKSQEARVEKTDPVTLQKCLTIVCEMVKKVSLKQLTPALQTLLETLILPGIQNEDPEVRNAAVRALGLCCLLNSDTARAHLLLFIQASQIDQEAIQITALQVIFDLLHLFGMETFNGDGNPEAEKPESPLDISGSTDVTITEPGQSGANKTASSVLNILIGLLDSQSSEVRTVVSEGMSKLLLSGRVVSAKLLSRLLLLWYNPITEDDAHLRHCLGVFFPVFSFAAKCNQDLVEEAMVATMNTLFEAPTSSPLAEINAGNVADLLIQLTNNRHLLGYKDDTQESCTHDSVALKICNEILSEPNSFDVRILCKMLTMLELSANNITNNKDLKVLGEQMLKEVKDNQCLKILEKFYRSVKDKVLMYNANHPSTPHSKSRPDTDMEVFSSQPEDAPPSQEELMDDLPHATKDVLASPCVTKKISKLSIADKTKDDSQSQESDLEEEAFITADEDSPAEVSEKRSPKRPAHSRGKSPKEKGYESPSPKKSRTKSTKVVTPTKTKSKTTEGETPTKKAKTAEAESPARGRPKKAESPVKAKSKNADSPARSGKTDSPARGRPKRGESSDKAKPKNTESPARGRPKKTESPGRAIAKKPESPARARSGKTDSPARGKVTKTDSPARGKAKKPESPARGKAKKPESLARGKAKKPESPARGTSGKTESPVRGRRGARNSPARAQAKVAESPARGKAKNAESPAHSKTTAAESPARSRRGKTDSPARPQTKKGESPARAKPAKVDTPTKAKAKKAESPARAKAPAKTTPTRNNARSMRAAKKKQDSDSEADMETDSPAPTRRGGRKPKAAAAKATRSVADSQTDSDTDAPHKESDTDSPFRQLRRTKRLAMKGIENEKL